MVKKNIKIDKITTINLIKLSISDKDPKGKITILARIVIFPLGSLSEIDNLIRFIVVILSILIFFLTKKNLVYPTIFSAIILSLLSYYL